MALLVVASVVVFVGVPAVSRRLAVDGMWDLSMLRPDPGMPWYANLWIWWAAVRRDLRRAFTSISGKRGVRTARTNDDDSKGRCVRARTLRKGEPS